MSSLQSSQRLASLASRWGLGLNKGAALPLGLQGFSTSQGVQWRSQRWNQVEADVTPKLTGHRRRPRAECLEVMYARQPGPLLLFLVFTDQPSSFMFRTAWRSVMSSWSL